jgi:hypothetical protein
MVAKITLGMKVSKKNLSKKNLLSKMKTEIMMKIRKKLRLSIQASKK